MPPIPSPPPGVPLLPTDTVASPEDEGSQLRDTTSDLLPRGELEAEGERENEGVPVPPPTTPTPSPPLALAGGETEGAWPVPDTDGELEALGEFDAEGDFDSKGDAEALIFPLLEAAEEAEEDAEEVTVGVALAVLESKGETEGLGELEALPVFALEGEGRTLTVKHPVGVEAPPIPEGEPLPLLAPDDEAEGVLRVETEGEAVSEAVPELVGVGPGAERETREEIESLPEGVTPTELEKFPVWEADPVPPPHPPAEAVVHTDTLTVLEGEGL